MQDTLIENLLPVVPLLPFLASLVCHGQKPRSAGILATAFAGISTVLALGLVGLMLAGGGATGRLLGLDGLSSVMVVLVSFLGTVVLRFSQNYLAGDPGQSRFFSWMSLTLASVLTLVLSANMLLLWAAWIATSLSLHRLLMHHPERAGAVFSARKKFVFSRMGDASLLGAILLLAHFHGTWSIGGVVASVSGGNTGGLPLAGFLLAGCGALKSAQFPFHSWLPDTMETPTPVSAFMHAGIINAGGFLVIRFAPVFAHAEGALWMLAVMGTVTAGFGAIVMLAQPSVKRSLAFSTIAQMGFMMLQCGLGAFSLALLHIVAHSLYKAHAFLTAGSTVGAAPRAAIILKTPALGFGVLAGGVMVAGGATALHLVAPEKGAAGVVFGVVLALALAYGMARAWSVGGGVKMVVRAGLSAVVIAVLSLALHYGAGAMFGGFPVIKVPMWLTVSVVMVFVGLFLFQALLWRAGRHELGRRLYVHALNGFYFTAFANRLLSYLWPRHPISRSQS